MATLLALLFDKLGGPIPTSCLVASVTRLPQALAHFFSLNLERIRQPGASWLPLLLTGLFLTDHISHPPP